MGTVDIGAVLDGRYRLDEIIGTGAMGTVFKATHLTVRRPVAIKILNEYIQHHPKLQQRFEIEARAVGALNHPNVLTLFDFAYSMDKDVLYMVVEFIDGETLTSLLRAPIAPKLSTQIAYQVANALSHAHAHGVAHRDLKPGNVMLAAERGGKRVKVLDFGLARVLEGKGKRTTGIGGYQGAPGYMSPEQCGDEQAGPESDIYALGCMLYEMYEGQLPFDYEAPGKLMNAHLHEEPSAPSNPEVPEAIRRLVLQMLAKAPADRPTADQVMAALQPYVEVDVSMDTLLRDGAPVSAANATPPDPAPVPSRTPLLAAIAVLALVAIVAVVYAATR